MKATRTHAIVLRRTNYGEADRILQLLTPNGKCSVIVRGVRREKSRLAGGIELFAVCDVVINKGKSELGLLTSARLVCFYCHIMKDYDRMQFAYTAIRLVSKASEMVDGSEWYDLLAEVLASLDKLLIRLETIQAWFYLRYSALMGYELSLWHDTDGEKLSVDEAYRYDVADKGLRMVSCGELASSHIKLLRLMATRSIVVISQIGGIDDIINDCLSVAREHAAI
ncbi:MAG: repair protein RecO [Patescibacteria group bacterium]|nr:repair protein RecO [Patescibacteria group bacterium]